jgi:hypothetical protein
MLRHLLMLGVLTVTCNAETVHAQQVSLVCSGKTIDSCPICRTPIVENKWDNQYITFDLSNSLVLRSDEYTYKITSTTPSDIFWGGDTLSHKGDDLSGHFSRVSLSGIETFHTGSGIETTNYYENCRLAKPRF